MRAAGGVTTSSAQAHSVAAHRFSGKTRLVALLGSPVAHSRSPKLQNGVFAALGVDLAYLAFDVPLPKLGDAVRGLRALDVHGAAVTMPLKRAICAYLDKLSPAAELAGAVNTVVNDGGVLTGHITDGVGYALSLQDAGVEFCIIGGVAAIAHGALTPTHDLDVAAPMTVENLERLFAALAPYRPKHATRPDLGVITASLVDDRIVRVLSLDQLIEVKAHVRRPKDRIVEAELRAIRNRLGVMPSTNEGDADLS